MNKLIKNSQEIEQIRISGKILAGVLRELKARVVSGVTTIELDSIAQKLIVESGGKPAFLGYKPAGALRPFPHALCASVNQIIVHGLPSDTPLRNGDIVSLDLGVNWQGWMSDSAITVAVGNIPHKTQLLMNATERALESAIEQAVCGNTLGDIGYVIEESIISSGFWVVEDLVGHGIGRKVHEEPTIFNFGNPGEGLELKEGMVLAIEPMAGLTTGEIIQLSDDSFATKDGGLSAHFEHTVLVKKDKAEILTK